MQHDLDESGRRLNALLAASGLDPLDDLLAVKFQTYLELLLRWNARINLTAIRDTEGILSRHFVESIACARALPQETATLLDLGSGAGFPGLPVALCRPEIAVTLAESQGKKAAFLNEVIRALGIPVQVHSSRAESLKTQFDCVALRAVDRMEDAMGAASQLVCPGGLLALMTTRKELDRLKVHCGSAFSWHSPIPLPASSERILIFATKLPMTS